MSGVSTMCYGLGNGCDGGSHYPSHIVLISLGPECCLRDTPGGHKNLHWSQSPAVTSQLCPHPQISSSFVPHFPHLSNRAQNS
jgi:hypothetical protein